MQKRMCFVRAEARPEYSVCIPAEDPSLIATIHTKGAAIPPLSVADSYGAASSVHLRNSQPSIFEPARDPP